MHNFWYHRTMITTRHNHFLVSQQEGSYRALNLQHQRQSSKPCMSYRPSRDAQRNHDLTHKEHQKVFFLP